ncbi:RUN and FYVE domain-containing protein 1 [Desmophyllum pertusum]|uniref:RUN and FYVE domain-containing protein 1 n=1 Tax=Desmophyllum pertusum TaxID=174260 RepID=A0A9X0D181_9CNID|nr:RUN and FYVE domain-containing protein 1 [Desmophyllum pertusum]
MASASLEEEDTELNFGKLLDYWGPLEALEQVAPDSSEIVRSVQNLPNIRTNHGKGRAWVRLALMQKN